MMLIQACMNLTLNLIDVDSHQIFDSMSVSEKENLVII